MKGNKRKVAKKEVVKERILLSPIEEEKPSIRSCGYDLKEHSKPAKTKSTWTISPSS